MAFRARASLNRCLFSLGLLYLYFVHLPLLRVLGPVCALMLTRATSLGTWLLTSVGIGKDVREAMRQVVPQIRPDLSVSGVLRRYWMIKQEQFALEAVFSTVRGRQFVERVSRQVVGREYLDAAVENGRGVIVAIFHFGIVRVTFSALLSIGYDSYFHAVRAEGYADRSFDFVARAVMNRKVQIEKSTGRKVIYHKPGETFKRIAELLRSNAIVMVGGDGMAGSRFVELPFLSGTMSFPTGLAGLAAETGAAIVCLFPVRESMTRHRCVLHPPIYCNDRSQASIEAAVRAYVRIFEENVRQFPWMWWSWRRIAVEQKPGRRAKFVVKGTPTEATRYYTDDKEATAGETRPLGR